MTLLKETQKYLHLAAQDEVVLDKLLEDKDISDSIWGFHAQQAAEKLMKAALSKKNTPFQKTHDLALLYQLITSSGVKLPITLDELDQLSPFAVQIRYDDEMNISLDRDRMRKMILKLRNWVEAYS